MNRKVCAAGALRLCSVVVQELKVSLLVGLVLLLGFMAGCTSQAGAPRWADRQIRPATDTTRLVRNAAYLKRIGRLELGLKELEEAHLREPQNLEILDLLTQCYEEIGDFDRAQELYEAALSLGGSHPALENNRCYSLYLRGRLDQAEACFRKVLAKWPENQTARNNLGLVLSRQGRETEALTVWREAMSDVEARQRLGQALAALGKEVPPSLAGPPQVQKAPSAPPPQASSQPANKVDSRTPATPISQKPAGMEQHAAVTPPSGNTVATTASSPARSSSLPEQAMVKAATSSPESTPSPVPPVQAQGDSHPEKAQAAAPDSISRPKKNTAALKVPTAKVTKTETPTPTPTDPPPYLTAQELIQAQIEIKNGNGVQGHARMMGGLLVLDGFNVVGIGNHAHFGLKKTVIAYRAEAARVAQALSKKFFPDAILELKEEGKLSSQTDVRVSLGRDLNPDEERLAMLVP